MRIPLLLALMIFLHVVSCGQTGGRIQITSITPSENTGQDYSSWFNDDLNNLVPNNWNSANFKWIDVTLQLAVKSKVTKLSLYDFEGVFTDNPASIYARNGSQTTLIGTFTGELYKSFVELVPDQSIIADAIVIHKYCNNIPQKVQVFGVPYDDGNPGDPGEPLPRAVITFDNLPVKTAGDPPFTLQASSSNPQTPLQFISSNPAVVSLNYSSGSWTATRWVRAPPLLPPRRPATKNLRLPQMYLKP